MEFQWPSSLALLVVVAALAVLYIVEQRRRLRWEPGACGRYSALRNATRSAFSWGVKAIPKRVS